MESMLAKDNQKIPREHYEEKTACCGCCSTKCIVITLSIFLILDFFIELINLYKIGSNKYFEPEYLYVYGALVFVLFVAVVLVCYYLFAPDSKDSRSVVPSAFLIAGIAGVLIALWIVVYILFLYPKNEVYVTGLDDNKIDK